MYEGIRSEILYATKFDENSDLGTKYLGRIDMIRPENIKAEKKISYIRTRLHNKNIIRWY